MISSNSFELQVIGPGERILFEGSGDDWGPRSLAGDEARIPFSASLPFSIRVRRLGDEPVRLRLKLGDEVIAEIPSSAARFESAHLPWLRNEFGETRIALEREGDGLEDYRPILAFDLEIQPRPEVFRDFQVMMGDLSEIHEGLALDITGRGYARRGRRRGPVGQLQPRLVIGGLRALYQRLEHALGQIADQPSTRLDWSLRESRYRGGDRVGVEAIASAVRDPATRLDPAGRVLALGKIRARKPVVSEDLPEHRQMAEGLRRLAARAEALARHCEQSASILEREQGRWRRPAGESPTAPVTPRDFRRMESLRGWAHEAGHLADHFRDLIASHDFLANAGPPRSALSPTPAFLGRLAYREVYRALVQAREPLGVLVDGESIRLSYRDLPTLFEYWCFLKTIQYLRHRFPLTSSRSAFTLTDEIYRPELAPGQSFQFEVAPGCTLTATYEPEIPSAFAAERTGARLAAAFTRDPLRPDILLELARGPDLPPAILILDAKSTDLFSPMKFREMADYSRQVFNPKTGEQPVRQVVLLHRDRGSRPLANIPHYFEGHPVPPDSVILGAVPCTPNRAQPIPPGLMLAIDRFLEIFGPPSASPPPPQQPTP